MNGRRKILLTAGIVLGLAILLPVIRHYQLRAATEAYLAELKARGEPVELAQVIPPPVPPEQNGADTFREAVAQMDPDNSLLATNYAYGMRMVAPGRAMVQWQQPDIRDNDGTNSWENVTAAMVQSAKALILLQQIIDKPTFDFQIKYDQGIAGLGITNLYLAESKRSAQRLESAALCALHQGDTAAAVKNLRAMLALVKAMRDERLIISELVRIAIAAIAQKRHLGNPAISQPDGRAACRNAAGLDGFELYPRRRKRDGDGVRERTDNDCEMAEFEFGSSRLPGRLDPIWTSRSGRDRIGCIKSQGQGDFMAILVVLSR